jgi:hypothetical protein
MLHAAVIAAPCLVLFAAGCSDDSETSHSAGGTSNGGGTGGAAAAAGGVSGDGGGGTGGMASGGCGAFQSDDVIARASVALNSCTSDDGFFRTQTYLRGVQGGYAYPGGRAFVDCLAAVTTGCDGVLACMGISPLQGGETCGTCQGNVAVVCGDANALWDCSTTNSTCESGVCIPAGTTSCQYNTFPDQCDAQGRPNHCSRYVQVGPDCAAFGLQCGDASFGTGCIGTGSSCSFDSFSDFDIGYRGLACDGASLHACVSGALADLDCACLGPGYTCQTSGGAYFCGAAADCDPATYSKTCEGSSAVFCNAGKLTSIDCTALGFTSCATDVRIGCM